MAVDKNGIGYTYGFAVGLVGIVAVLLAALATGLKPMQDDNIADEKRKFIMKASGIMSRDTSWSKEVVAEKFNEIILDSKILTFNGEDTLEGKSAFDIDIVKVYKGTKDPKKRVYPIFKVKGDNGNKFVVPMAGKGLWGPVWAYVAIEADGSTIAGAVFDHKSETPGLGGEIKDGKYFWSQFNLEKGLQIMDADGNYVGISAMKGGATNKHEIDAIAGATITSVGVGNMLKDSFKAYLGYMKENK